VRSGFGAEVERWSARVRAARGADALGRLRAAARGDEALGELVEALASAPGRAAGIAELNDRVSELARELQVGASVPRAAGRIALFSGVGLAVVAIAAGLPERGAGSVVPASVAFAAGLAGAGLCAGLGRAADQRGSRQRQAWAELRRVLERVLPT
jgi:hypothetical protein